MKKGPIPSEDLLLAIRAKCMDCCGRARNEVERCDISDCPLHPYRSLRAVGDAQGQPKRIDGPMDLLDVLPGEKGAGAWTRPR